MRPARLPFSALLLLTALASSVFSPSGRAQETAVSVKSYLLNKLEKMNEASKEFVTNSEAYSALISKNGGSVEAAFKADPKEIYELIAKMQENYKAIDSFGYETVEGIVAGVPLLADYDIYLDAGVPASEGPENVAPVVVDLGNGQKIDKQGSLFTYIIEPALWGGDKRWVTPVDGGGKLLPLRRF